MRRICLTVIATVIVAAAHPLAARADQGPISTPVPEAPPSQAQIQTQASAQTQSALQRAVELTKSHDAARALPLIRQVLSAPDFASLTSADQHEALLVGGYCEYMTQHAAAAIPLLQRSSQMPEANPNDWMVMLGAAEMLKDGVTAAEAVTTLARRWPAALDLYEDSGTIAYAVQLLDKVPNTREARLQVLSSLYDAHWPEEQFSDWSRYWRELALMLLEGGDQDRANEVAKSILVPTVLAGIRVDRRFDPIVQKNPDRFDLGKAMDSFIAEIRARSKAHPDKLGDLERLANDLIQAGRDEEALKLLDDAIERTRASPSAFSDTKAHIMWVHNARSHALRHMGHYEEALAAMRAGMQYAEDGGANISQVVNLADLLDDLGRPKEALEVISHAGSGSDYGKLAVESAKASAYAQLGDRDHLGPLLADAREHLKDGPGVLQAMLIETDDLDGAAALYVRRLSDPDMRDEALLDLQDWPKLGSLTPRERELSRRAEAVRARPDVQAAINAVGRIETIPFRRN